MERMAYSSICGLETIQLLAGRLKLVGWNNGSQGIADDLPELVVLILE